MIRLVRGCSWNRCTFCTLFKGVPFSIRSVEDIKKDIHAARDFYKEKSGPLEVLKKVKKGITPATLVKSSLRAQEAGMKMMIFMILGLGGKELSQVHIEESAKVLNQIDSDKIRVLSLGVKPDTELGEMAADGSFTMLSEVEMLREQKLLFTLLDGISSRYGNYHAVNLLMEINGRLPEDKADFISVTDRFLNLSHHKQLNFILGRRLWHYQKLDDLNNPAVFGKVKKELENLQQINPEQLEPIFHDLRKQMI